MEEAEPDAAIVSAEGILMVSDDSFNILSLSLLPDTKLLSIYDGTNS
jgi:hypothetical protein